MGQNQNNLITVEEVVHLLGLESNGKVQFNVHCPFCDGDHRKKHLNINVLKGVFNCPKCESGGGAIALYGFFAKGIDPAKVKADKDLKISLIKEIRQKQGSTGYVPTAYHSAQLVEAIDVEPTDSDERDHTYRTLLSLLPLNEEHKNDLLRRGLTEEEIAAHGYKSTPQLLLKKLPEKLRLQGCALLGVPGFYQEDGEWKMVSTTTGYFVPVTDIKGRIIGMQIRADNDFASKYMWFSSSNKEKGCGAKTWPHFAGYPEKSVLLTEGPLKANIIAKFTDRGVIAVPGVNALSQLEPLLKKLKELGVEEIETAFDMDYKTNPNVQNAYNKLLALISSLGLRYKRLEWDETYKGYDDYLYSLTQSNQ